MDNQLSHTPKSKTHHCSLCDYKCSKLSDLLKHNKTKKHLLATMDKKQSPKHYQCEKCGNQYKYQSGLCKHRKVCTGKPASNTENNTTMMHDIIMKQQNQLKEQQEFYQKKIAEQMEEQTKFIQQQQEQHHKQIQELIPKLQQVTTINNNNSNNTTTNKFNLNFFLNEQCKDAISIQTFIENLDIGIKELEHMGNVGYLQGMMTIMSNTLGAMDVYKRPVHCTDLKRETVYIKDGDTWKKDNANNDDLRRVINTVANVNYRNLDVWESQHPDAFESDTPDNIEYCKIAMESLGGYDNSDDKIAIKLNKLVKHVVREVYVK